MNVNCNSNSDLRAIKLKPVLPDYLKGESVKDELIPEEREEIQKAIKPDPSTLSVTVRVDDALALYNIGTVPGAMIEGNSEITRCDEVSGDEILHLEGYDELVAEWEANNENLSDKAKISLLNQIIEKVGNDTTAENTWCAVRFEITNNVYLTNINNLDESTDLGLMCLMNYLSMLDNIKGDDKLAAKKCIQEGNPTEQKLAGYKALLAEQNALIATCNKLLSSPIIRRKDVPMVRIRLKSVIEKANFYESKIKELEGIRVHSGDLGAPATVQNTVD